jgi:hypothetical protein
VAFSRRKSWRPAKARFAAWRTATLAFDDSPCSTHDDPSDDHLLRRRSS